VEEMAAAADSLRGQADDLVQVVAAFQLEDHAPAPRARMTNVRPPIARSQTTPSLGHQAPKPRLPSGAKPVPRSASFTKPAALPKPAPKAAAKVMSKPAASTSREDDWESF
jgi:methyl-accepting chemotaxis protein